MTSITLTTGIIAITSVISWFAASKPIVLQRMMMNPYRITRNGEYYRFVTSGLIHANFSHLLWNMFSLYFFGNVVEQYFTFIFGEASPYIFVAFYVLAIIVSDLPTFFKNRNRPTYNSLGASGGVTAIIFASVLFQPLEKICFYFVFCLPGFILAVGYVVYSYYSGKKSNDNINHEAHLYGALFGVLFCAVADPSSVPLFIHQVSQWKGF